MDAELRKAMEARGYKFYDHAGDAVGMTEEEKQEMDLRLALSNAVRKRREKLGWSRKELATRIKVSQARLNKIEWGKWDVPLEQILQAYSAMNGCVATKELTRHAGNGAKSAAKRSRATA